jgi:plasmid stabilization system protein ParE
VKYQVIVTPEAQTGIRESFVYIHERSPLSAVRWLQALYGEIDTLGKGSRSVARSRESGSTSTRTSGNWCSNLIALCSRSKRKRSGFTFSMCVTPSGGLLVRPPRMKPRNRAHQYHQDCPRAAVQIYAMAGACTGLSTALQGTMRAFPEPADRSRECRD